MRDRIVAGACNWLIRAFASKEYNAFCTVITGLGLEALDKELGLERLDGKLVRRNTK